MKRMLCLFAALTFGGHASMAQTAPAGPSGSPTLDAVKSHGELACGVSGDTAGFSLPDSKGVMQGIDADYCRAVAAAVLGDANKVKFAPLTTQNRFTALQSGEVDLLVAQHHLDAGPRGKPRTGVRLAQLSTTAPASW